MIMMTNVYVVLLAGGEGSRYGGRKQFELMEGKPLWRWVFDAAAEVVAPGNILVVGTDVPAGDIRPHSVLNGLEALRKKGARDDERVIIAEAARPLVKSEQFRQLIDCGANSAGFVNPLVNTIIKRNGDPVRRSDYYELLTPFIFKFGLIYNAYKSGKYDHVTDDTRAVYEYCGLKPLLLETTRNLYKVTYPGDLEIVKALLKNMK
jgi:2-C-methyl-D-erythritol 4-phosphate cytidylyltransferase